MATDKQTDAAQSQPLFENPRTEPKIGPSDSSDTASELPDNFPETDSDRRNTGERAEVENRTDPAGADLEPDKITSGRKAGLARTPPDPVRNGG